MLMIEGFIKENGGEFTKTQIWQRLPRKVMYQTYQIAFDYLLDTAKIAVDREGHVCWIWDPEGVKRLLRKKHLFIR